MAEDRTLGAKIELQKKFKLTWKPDLPDFRDYEYSPPQGLFVPAKSDISPSLARVHNQGTLGSCTANAIAIGYDFAGVKRGLKPMIPSRLFIYYNEREIEGTITDDAGAYIRNGIKTVYNTGVCSEKLWDYNIKSFTKRPWKRCYDQAANNKVTQYMRIDNSDIMKLKSCLAEGYGFVFGFAVYDSFYNVNSSGKMAMPLNSEKMLGGHAVFCVGYDDATQCFKIRNSWGIGWADKGHFYMPYQYMTNTNLCDDFWTMRRIN